MPSDRPSGLIVHVNVPSGRLYPLTWEWQCGFILKWALFLLTFETGGVSVQFLWTLGYRPYVKNYI
jgi:hypothetical protein